MYATVYFHLGDGDGLQIWLTPYKFIWHLSYTEYDFRYIYISYLLQPYFAEVWDIQFSKFGVQAPLLRYSLCVVSQFFIVGNKRAVVGHECLWLLDRQKGFGYILCPETPLHKYTATLCCVEFWCAAPFIRFLTEFWDRNNIFREYCSI